MLTLDTLQVVEDDSLLKKLAHSDPDLPTALLTDCTGRRTMLVLIVDAQVRARPRCACMALTGVSWNQFRGRFARFAGTIFLSFE